MSLHHRRPQQSHSGVVGGSTPSVQYTYDMSATSGLLNNRARLEQLTYPDGRALFYDYGSSDGIDDLLSRSYRLRETNGSGTIFVQYSRTGGGQTVVTDYQQPDLKLDLFQGTSGTYAGLDRFGRTIDHLWDGYNSTADAVQLKYGYDYAGSRTWREDLVAANNSQKYDELYTYDGLDRLTGLARGEINGTYTVISSDTFGQDWELEQQGNWSNFLEDSDGNGSDDLDQDRSHNEANEITDIDASSANVGHDATGNMTTVPLPGSWSSNYTLTWDAWNRLVKVADGGTTVAEYGYDGKNRRIVKQVYSGGLLDETQHHYLSLQNQVLEVRLDSDTDAHKQFTWGSRYIDDLVLRERDTTGNGVLDERLYALQDANWNITALSDTSGTIAERFHYDPYGKSTVLESDFTLDGDGVSDKDWEFRYTSREFDTETGLQYYRARYYHSGLGRFLSRDPIGFYGSPWNLYNYVSNDPLYFIDPFGLSKEPCPKPSAKVCNTAIKILDQFDRLFRKIKKKPMPKNQADKLKAKRDDGTITSGDLPGTLTTEFPGELVGMTLDEIRKLCGKRKRPPNTPPPVVPEPEPAPKPAPKPKPFKPIRPFWPWWLRPQNLPKPMIGPIGPVFPGLPPGMT